MKRKNIKQNTIFAEGFCFTKIFIFFMIGCVVGTYYEELLHIIKFGIWESRRGLIYGPFNQVYGLTIAGIIAILGKNINKRPTYLTYIYCCLIGGVSEYILSSLQEIIFSSHSWNYNGYFLNINGKTTIPFMLFWGLGGLIFLKIVYPYISSLIEKIPYKVGNILFYIFLIFMIVNILLSCTSLIRQVNRRNGEKPHTFIGEIYDKIYTDEFLDKIYANAVAK